MAEEMLKMVLSEIREIKRDVKANHESNNLQHTEIKESLGKINLETNRVYKDAYGNGKEGYFKKTDKHQMWLYIAYGCLVGIGFRLMFF